VNYYQIYVFILFAHCRKSCAVSYLPQQAVLQATYWSDDVGMLSLAVIHDSCGGNVWGKEHTLLATW